MVECSERDSVDEATGACLKPEYGKGLGLRCGAAAGDE